ncbi:Enteropeptidase [Eumeta japonica]|uniref:Enteropeptidase n=1 Tax=Eumeta variegata TaxID=151549 RepID=A0A4C1TKL9_EUMVA|nr:Enteropeptidase [Eumeta japonica]
MTSICFGYLVQPRAECGVPDVTFTPRIVGGIQATEHSYPWIVAIMREDTVHCGASLLTDRHLLCAGHCFRWSDHTQMEVILGLDSLDDLSDVVFRRIKDVTIHEEFTSTQVRDDSDVSVVTLDLPIQFGPAMLPICLPSPTDDYTDWTATVAGWGRVGTNDPTSSSLQQANVRVLSRERCFASELSPHLTENMMCAFAEGKDGCQVLKVKGSKKTDLFYHLQRNVSLPFLNHAGELSDARRRGLKYDFPKPAHSAK